MDDGPERIQQCLGNSCRWFKGKPDARCFHVGVLPYCSPTLKVEMKKRKAQEVADAQSGGV